MDTHPVKGPQLAVRKPVPRFWFEDGNVVLSADVVKEEDSEEGPPTTALFRVHKSQLSIHSKIFGDMFNLGDGMERSSELYEGAPLVHLHDPALDVDVMLTAIYCPL